MPVPRTFRTADVVVSPKGFAVKVVVVGGTGSIGSRVVARLLDAGHSVSCVTRGLQSDVAQDARLIQGDRRDIEWFTGAMQREKFDAAIDMLAFTAEDAMASVAAFRGVSHYVHTSSVRVYGTDFSWLPISEDHPLRPTVPYARGKVEAERTFFEAHYRDDFPATILRLSTTYGPRWIVRQLCLDTSWIDRILTGRPIATLGDGRAVHHFLHVDDAAGAFVSLLGKDEAVGKPYNVVNPHPTTWFAYHQTAIDVLGADVEQVSVPVKAVLAIDPRRFELADGVFSQNLLYDPTRLLREIPDWRPCIGLEEGLRTSFEYVAEQGLIEPSVSGGWEDQLVARFGPSASSSA